MFDHTSSFHNQQQIKTTTNNFQALIFSCSTTQHNTTQSKNKQKTFTHKHFHKHSHNKSLNRLLSTCNHSCHNIHNNRTLPCTNTTTKRCSTHNHAHNNNQVTQLFSLLLDVKKSCLKSSKLITQVCTQHCAFMNLLQQKQSTTINSHQSQFHWCTAKSIDPVISTITTTQLHSHSTILSCCSFMPHTIQSFPWSQNHKITKSQNHNMCHVSLSFNINNPLPSSHFSATLFSMHTTMHSQFTLHTAQHECLW